MALTQGVLKLSILILTIPSREHLLQQMLRHLKPQIVGKPVEILVNRNPTQSIGKKRQTLLGMASGVYVVSADEDDYLARDYVDKILKATETNPDCIGISGVITTNGRNLKNWHISLEYKKWEYKEGVYYRSPNHISPVRRELALKAGFPDISHGEDAEYSRRLIGLLSTEVKIAGVLYTYRYNSRKK